MNPHQAIKFNARVFAKRPYASGGFLGAFELAEAFGHVQPWEDFGGSKGKSADNETFRLANLANTRARTVAERYRRFVNYMRETRHDWQEIGQHSYADNSIEVVEQSRRTGEKRQRMTVAPHGDACF